MPVWMPAVSALPGMLWAVPESAVLLSVLLSALRLPGARWMNRSRGWMMSVTAVNLECKFQY